MKHHQHTTPRGPRTTLSEVCCWAQALIRLHTRIAPRFARPEPRRRALASLQGILSSIERKNGWQLAEHAREATPYGMQRLLSQAVWDADLVRDDLREYVLEQLGQESAFLVIDESSFPKRGDQSAGVGVQYCGTTGQVEKCQVGVFLAYVTARGHTLIDRELYLLPDWIEDQQRRHAVGIPMSVGFQTKPELARRMLQRVWEAQIPIAWVVADTVYGGNLDLRTWLQAHGYAYVLAVPCNEPVGIVEPSGRRRQVHVRDVPALLLQQHEWQRLSMSEGTQGPRLFDWARVPILHQWQQDGRHWLRLASEPERAYYFVFGPPATTLHEMVQALGTRWHIEEDFENTKDMGLDHYEVRGWIGWYRHITLVMLAHAFLTGICAQLEAPSVADSDTPIQASEEHEPSVVLPALLSLTVPEVRHLLGHLIWPAVISVTLVLAWSWWRRWHRSWASYYHCQRRLQAQGMCQESLKSWHSQEIPWECSPVLFFVEPHERSILMTLLPLRQGCALLGIDHKTLRHWMQQANLSLHPHPNDARIKCVTSEHLEQLAVRHRRPVDVPAALARLHSAQACPPLLPENPVPQTGPDLLSRLAHLETQVALLQQHLAGLALELLQERTQRYEQRLHTLETRIHPSSQHARSVSALPLTHEQRSQPDTPLNARRVHPAKGRPRAILPLIEYTADGTYIVICPHQGERALIPDSPAWFAWLETVSSLRFLGQQGRWSAYRDKRRTSCCWFAYRRVNGHQYVYALGSPHELTIACFEQMAATLQSFVTTS